eukprot:248575_1
MNKPMSKENQQTIIDSLGFTTILKAALTNNIHISLNSHQVHTLKGCLSSFVWDPQISPFINKTTDILCNLVQTHSWFQQNTFKQKDFEETIANIIYSYASLGEISIVLPSSITNETVFSIGISAIYECNIECVKNNKINVNNKGIVHGMKIWNDRNYTFDFTNSFDELTDEIQTITNYFEFNHKSNGKGTKPNIVLKQPQCYDCIYLFVEISHRDGGWSQTLAKLGWIKLVSPSRWTGVCSGNFRVWKWEINK